MSEDANRKAAMKAALEKKRAEKAAAATAAEKPVETNPSKNEAFKEKQEMLLRKLAEKPIRDRFEALRKVKFAKMTQAEYDQFVGLSLNANLKENEVPLFKVLGIEEQNQATVNLVNQELDRFSKKPSQDLRDKCNVPGFAYTFNEAVNPALEPKFQKFITSRANSSPPNFSHISSVNDVSANMPTETAAALSKLGASSQGIDVSRPYGEMENDAINAFRFDAMKEAIDGDIQKMLKTQVPAPIIAKKVGDMPLTAREKFFLINTILPMLQETPSMEFTEETLNLAPEFSGRELSAAKAAFASRVFQELKKNQFEGLTQEIASQIDANKAYMIGPFKNKKDESYFTKKAELGLTGGRHTRKWRRVRRRKVRGGALPEIDWEKLYTDEEYQFEIAETISEDDVIEFLTAVSSHPSSNPAVVDDFKTMLETQFPNKVAEWERGPSGSVEGAPETPEVRPIQLPEIPEVPPIQLSPTQEYRPQTTDDINSIVAAIAELPPGIFGPDYDGMRDALKVITAAQNQTANKALLTVTTILEKTKLIDPRTLPDHIAYLTQWQNPISESLDCRSGYFICDDATRVVKLAVRTITIFQSFVINSQKPIPDLLYQVIDDFGAYKTKMELESEARLLRDYFDTSAFAALRAKRLKNDEAIAELMSSYDTERTQLSLEHQKQISQLQEDNTRAQEAYIQKRTDELKHLQSIQHQVTLETDTLTLFRVKMGAEIAELKALNAQTVAEMDNESERLKVSLSKLETLFGLTLDELVATNRYFRMKDLCSQSEKVKTEWIKNRRLKNPNLSETDALALLEAQRPPDRDAASLTYVDITKQGTLGEAGLQSQARMNRADAVRDLLQREGAAPRVAAQLAPAADDAWATFMASTFPYPDKTGKFKQVSPSEAGITPDMKDSVVRFKRQLGNIISAIGNATRETPEKKKRAQAQWQAVSFQNKGGARTKKNRKRTRHLFLQKHHRTRNVRAPIYPTRYRKPIRQTRYRRNRTRQ